MAITSGASDGVRATTAAKDSLTGSAASLGSQAAAAADEVIVPNAIGTNNEGNLETTPTYVGRMICIRPWEMKLSSVEIQSGGTGHAQNDVITLAGVAGGGGAPTITVDAVSGGVITAVSITQAAGVQIRRGAMTNAPSPADNPVAQNGTTGSGISATFNCVWEPHFEIRFITADASNTLTVHEEWLVPPVSGDEWALSYILEDMATVTGCTLRAQSGVFEFSRLLKVGPVTDSAVHGWLSQNSGKQLELDNSTLAAELANGSVLTVGYLKGGVAVDGGYWSTSGTSGAGFRIHTHNGCLFYLYDWQVRSPREQFPITGAATAYSAAELKFKREVGATFQKVKLFDAGNPIQLSAIRVRDVYIQTSATYTNGIAPVFRLAPSSTGVDTSDIDGLIIQNDNAGGRGMAHDNAASSAVGEPWRNVTWVNENHEYIDVATNVRVIVVNPTWAVTLADRTNIDFVTNADAETELEVQFSIGIAVSEPDGTPIGGAHCYIYEGALNDNLQDENTNQSDTDVNGDYSSDVLLDTWQGDTGGTLINASQAGGFAWRCYDYGKLPGFISITPEGSSTEGVAGQVLSATLLVDSDITESDQSTALTNPTSNPVVTRHGPGETDTRPMKALAYDTGTGGVAPSLGETITGTTSGADGVVVEVVGDDVSGTILMDTWDGNEFTENEQLTGGTSAFDALADIATFYEEYTWEVEAQSESVTILYDYLAARMAEATLTAPFDDVIVWGGDDPDATQLLFLGTNGYFTPRSVSRRDGQIQAGATRDFTDAFPQADSALSADSDWDDVDNAASGLQVISNAVAGDATTGQTNVGAVASATHAFTNNQYAEGTITALPTAGDRIGVACRIDVSQELCYAAIVAEGTPDTYEIVLVDFSTAAGTVTTLATGASTPSASDSIRLTCVGPALVMFVNEVEEARVTNGRILSGQAGIFAEGDTAQVGRLDDWGGGDVVGSILQGEGVWIHERGAGNYDYFTSDEGVQYQLPATVTLSVQVNDEAGDPVEGARVRIANDPDSAGATSIAEGTTNASGVFSSSFTYTSDVDVITKVRLKGFQNFRTTGTIDSNGLTVAVRFVADNIVDLP